MKVEKRPAAVAGLGSDLKLRGQNNEKEISSDHFFADTCRLGDSYGGLHTDFLKQACRRLLL
jgi:hypothetical protein